MLGSQSTSGEVRMRCRRFCLARCTGPARRYCTGAATTRYRRAMTVPATREALVAQLQALGVVRGGPLMLHASLRAVGPVEGRGDGLLTALLAALGPGGTLVMALDAAEGPFDALTTPVDVKDMGVLAELFRRTPGVQVSDHVCGRHAALGPQAHALLHPVPLHDYLGPGSILERFTELDGQVLRLGADIDTVTLTHYAEYLADVPNKRRVRRKLVRADVGEQVVESLDDSEGIADWPHGDYFSQILVDFLATGQARVGRVGQCHAELFGARAFVDHAVTWMETHLCRA